MNQLHMPLKIRFLIDKKPFIVDDIGMSGNQVLVFEDMVLKIEDNSTSMAKQVQVMQWLEGKIPVPQVHRSDRGGVLQQLHTPGPPPRRLRLRGGGVLRRPAPHPLHLQLPPGQRPVRSGSLPEAGAPDRPARWIGLTRQQSPAPGPGAGDCFMLRSSGASAPDCLRRP